MPKWNNRILVSVLSIGFFSLSNAEINPNHVTGKFDGSYASCDGDVSLCRELVEKNNQQLLASPTSRGVLTAAAGSQSVKTVKRDSFNSGELAAAIPQLMGTANQLMQQFGNMREQTARQNADKDQTKPIQLCPPDKNGKKQKCDIDSKYRYLEEKDGQIVAYETLEDRNAHDGLGKNGFIVEGCDMKAKTCNAVMGDDGKLALQSETRYGRHDAARLDSKGEFHYIEGIDIEVPAEWDSQLKNGTIQGAKFEYVFDKKGNVVEAVEYDGDTYKTYKVNDTLTKGTHDLAFDIKSIGEPPKDYKPETLRNYVPERLNPRYAKEYPQAAKMIEAQGFDKDFQQKAIEEWGTGTLKLKNGKEFKQAVLIDPKAGNVYASNWNGERPNPLSGNVNLDSPTAGLIGEANRTISISDGYMPDNTLPGITGRFVLKTPPTDKNSSGGYVTKPTMVSADGTGSPSKFMEISAVRKEDKNSYVFHTASIPVGEQVAINENLAVGRTLDYSGARRENLLVVVDRKTGLEQVWFDSGKHRNVTKPDDFGSEQRLFRMEPTDLKAAYNEEGGNIVTFRSTDPKTKDVAEFRVNVRTNQEERVSGSFFDKGVKDPRAVMVDPKRFDGKPFSEVASVYSHYVDGKLAYVSETPRCSEASPCYRVLPGESQTSVKGNKQTTLSVAPRLETWTSNEKAKEAALARFREERIKAFTPQPTNKKVPAAPKQGDKKP